MHLAFTILFAAAAVTLANAADYPYGAAPGYHFTGPNGTEWQDSTFPNADASVKGKSLTNFVYPDAAKNDYWTVDPEYKSSVIFTNTAELLKSNWSLYLTNADRAVLNNTRSLLTYIVDTIEPPVGTRAAFGFGNLNVTEANNKYGGDDVFKPGAGYILVFTQMEDSSNVFAKSGEFEIKAAGRPAPTPPPTSGNSAARVAPAAMVLGLVAVAVTAVL